MKLHASLTSPYARKVRILIREKRLAIELIEQDPWHPASAVPGVNPLGKVPVLELNDGRTLFESVFVLEYLDGLGGPPLIPPSGEARLEAQRWHALGHGLMDATVTRTLELRRPDAQRSPANLARQEAKIARALDAAEQWFTGAGAFLTDGRFTVADIVLGAALQYVDFRYPHAWQSAHPRIAAWLAAIAQRGSFLETRPPG